MSGKERVDRRRRHVNRRQWLETRGVSRRQGLKGTAGAAAFAAGMGPWIVSGASDELVVSSYGGEFEKIYKKTVVEPFEKKFGVKVIYDPKGSSSQKYARIRATKGSPGFDVAAEQSPEDIILGQREGLILPMTEREVPEIAGIFPGARKPIPPYGVIHSVQYVGLLYNPDHLDAPDSWWHYWEAWKKYGEKIRKRLLMFNTGNVGSIYLLILGAELGGGGIDNMDPVWPMLQALKPYIGPTMQNSVEAVPYYENEDVWLSPYWSARSSLFISRGLNMRLVAPKEGVYMHAACMSIPIGTKNKKLAYEFVNFRISKEVQREFCLGYHISPTRGDITDWPDWFSETQFTTAKKWESVQIADPEIIGAKRGEWTVKWQEIMGA